MFVCMYVCVYIYIYIYTFQLGCDWASNGIQLGNAVLGAVHRAKYRTPETAKVKLHWKMPLNIQWTILVNIHWTSVNPLGNTTEQ